jgi:hypothetical protein
MSNKPEKTNEIEPIVIPDDAYVYKYGMTIKEIREQIQYKIASVNVSFHPASAVSISGAGKDDEEIEEEDEQTDSSAWDLYFPYGNLSSSQESKDSSRPSDEDERTSEWDDEEVNRPYRPSWAKEIVTDHKPLCQHKKTRDVELIFTVATECVDCGERLK